MLGIGWKEALMPQITGIVQRLQVTLDYPAGICVWIGPSPTNVEALIVAGPGVSGTNADFLATMAAGLINAQVNRREVVVVTQNNPFITSFTINP
ncbi:MAG: hypothetical protein ACXVH5_13645 [Ilumatobacteraceae bacterium]